MLLFGSIWKWVAECDFRRQKKNKEHLKTFRLKVNFVMKTDIITVVILVFCVGVLISALGLGDFFSADQAATTVVQQSR